ncbi:MAG: hypothetical protein SP1CHLAM54_08890 [Chlamydiia bacterium]|nr:hypothetical protein [Chlamydiia bacterium]MCH9615795.1 hypothetical protein [Chlamydiia bacterium]MCH9628802.1 hypothetical protein [Chlamydiia bacterium]
MQPLIPAFDRMDPLSFASDLHFYLEKKTELIPTCLEELGRAFQRRPELADNFLLSCTSSSSDARMSVIQVAFASISPPDRGGLVLSKETVNTQLARVHHICRTRIQSRTIRSHIEKTTIEIRCSDLFQNYPLALYYLNLIYAYLTADELKELVLSLTAPCQETLYKAIYIVDGERSTVPLFGTKTFTDNPKHPLVQLALEANARIFTG